MGDVIVCEFLAQDGALDPVRNASPLEEAMVIGALTRMVV